METRNDRQSIDRKLLKVEHGWDPKDPRFLVIQSLYGHPGFDALVELLLEMRALAVDSLPALVLDDKDEAQVVAVKIDLLDHIMAQLHEITTQNDEQEVGDE